MKGVANRLTATAEVGLLLMLFFVVAGNPPPAINEAHYLVLAKNFWQPDWCAADAFVRSAKPHLLFHATFGSLTQIVSLAAAAWIGRLIGWLLLAVTLRSLTRAVCPIPYACVAVAVVWIAGIQWFNLAGEWVIGGIEAKVPAYAFTLAAMTCIAGGYWRSAWPLLGIASAFHVLVGGWTVVATMVAYLVVGRHQSSPRRQIVPLLIGGTIALLGLWPALQTSAAADPADSLLAARIYTYSRISHHLLPSSFPPHWYLRHLCLVAVSFAIAWPLRHERTFAALFWLAVGCVAIAACGLLLGLLPAVNPDLAAKLLRFYWFRASDAVLPLTLGLAIVATLARRQGFAEQVVSGPGEGGGWKWGRDGIGVVVVAIAVVLVGYSSIDDARRAIPPASRFDVVTHGQGESFAAQRRAHEDWLAVCHWIDATLPANEILITPRHQYTFKWYAQRAEVVNWKDVPQDAGSLVRWYRRFFDVYPRRLGTVRVTIRYADLRRFQRQYGARFVIVDRRVVGESLPLVQVYPQAGDPPNATYAVYRLPYPAAELPLE